MPSLLNRAIGDVRAVYKTATPPAAALWLTSVITHLPTCARTRSLSPADHVWARRGASFAMPNHVAVSLPAAYVLGAREMYCRNVYLRTGLIMPTSGWVVDLGANRGLFSVWAAVSGAHVAAVEAQQGYAPLIDALATHNRVSDRVHVEVALASGARNSGALIGVVSDDRRWESTSHGGPRRPQDVSVPELMTRYEMGHIGLLKMDIEGGEFAILAEDEDLRWLERIKQIALEVHPVFGDAQALIRRLQAAGFKTDLRDNDGNRVPAASNELAYAYCRR